jgi:hypothetical protein
MPNPAGLCLDHPAHSGEPVGSFLSPVVDLAFHVSGGVAQLEEQLVCNQQVAGSSPVSSTTWQNASELCPTALGE